MPNDLYILLGYLIFTMIALAIMYLLHEKIEFSILLYILSTWITAFFFNNEQIWVNDDIAPGIENYARVMILALIGVLGYYKFFINWNRNKLKVPIHLFLLSIFLIYSTLSISYSVDPSSTLNRVSIFILTFGFFLWLNVSLKDKESFEKVLNLIFYFFLSILILTVIVTIILPNRVWWWKEPTRFIGVGVHPGELGSLSMIFYPILLWKISKTNGNQKISLYTILFSVIIMHFFTGSRTTLGAAFVGFLIWLFINKKWSKLFASFIGSVVLITVFSYGLPDSMKRDEGTGILSLSSREIIWDGAYKLFWEKPLIGFGYRVESKIFDNQSVYDISDTFITPTAQQPLHGGYLSILMGGGIIGFSIWLLVLLTPIFNILRSGINELKAVLIIIMISILITNITETALTGYQGITDIFFWITWVMAGKIWEIDILPNKTIEK